MNIDKNECPNYLFEYVFYLKVIKGRGDRTVDAYYNDIKLFLRYIIMSNNNKYKDTEISEIPFKDFSEEQIKKITINNIIEFLYYTANDRNNNATTRARKTSSIKNFFKYLSTNTTIIDKNPAKDLELPTLKKSLPRFLSLEESIELLKVSNNDSLRDYCIITLFLNCGMRLSELVGININDINFGERTLRLLGKGNKERIIYLNDSCINTVQTYYNSRINPKSEPNALFLSKFNKRISKRRVQQIVETCLYEAHLNNRGLSTHKLRHTAATLMYQHGNVDTLVLKEILGHKSIATTEIYTHVSNENMKKAADSSPLAKVKMSVSSEDKTDKNKN